MPATPIRRHRLTAPLAGVVVALGLLVGCTGQQDAGDYGDDVRRDFVAGCSGSAFEDEKDAAILQEGSLSAEQCGCAYDAIEEQVEFEDFKRINSDLRDEPAELDPAIAEVAAAAVASCGQDDPTPTTQADAPTTSEADAPTTTAG